MRMTAEDSLVAFDEEGVRVVFKLKKGESETDTIIKAVISNSTPGSRGVHAPGRRPEGGSGDAFSRST